MIINKLNSGRRLTMTSRTKKKKKKKPKAIKKQSCV